jgi:hypothetical protein
MTFGERAALGSRAALRLTWLKARAHGEPRARLLRIVRICHARNLSIPEIDAYVVEQLVSARLRLKDARSSGLASEKSLRALEHAIHAVEHAEKTRRDLRHPFVPDTRKPARGRRGVR